MKLSIAKDQLSDGLQSIHTIVPSRTTLPILSNALVRTVEGQVELTATDLDVTISATVEAKVDVPGAVTLPVKKLASIVRELAVGDIEFEVDDKLCAAISAGPSFFRINGLSADDFPPMPDIAGAPFVTMPQDRFKRLIQRTAFAASTDESRYVLNGLFFSFKEHKLTTVATDGRRLALAEDEVELSLDGTCEFIVPSKAVAEISRLVKGTGEVEIWVAQNQAAFNFKPEQGVRSRLVTKLVEGVYPSYQQVIPRESKERVALVREEFVQALRRAEIMTSEKSNSVKLSFTRDNLLITSNTQDVGEARESLAVNYKGTDMVIAFNPRFLLDALEALDEDEVYLELTDELSPGLLKTTSPFLYVIMPMRLN